MDDILFVILLYSDIDVIKNYAETSKKTILNDYFWQCKFKQDNIPIFNNVCINEYIKISNIIITVNQLHQLLLIEKGTDGIQLMIEFDATDDITPLIPEEIHLGDILDQCLKQFITIYYFDHIQVGLYRDYLVSAEEEIITITIDEMLNILIKIIYYFPNRPIVDDDCINFILRMPHHKNAWPKHMDMINKRYEFWTKQI